MNVAIDAVGGGILAVSNFTVFGDASQRRPSFTASASFEQGRLLFEKFLSELRSKGVQVETGEFGGDMLVTIANDGPVALVVDTR